MLDALLFIFSIIGITILGGIAIIIVILAIYIIYLFIKEILKHK
jgi:hypothetical protein